MAANLYAFGMLLYQMLYRQELSERIWGTICILSACCLRFEKENNEVWLQSPLQSDHEIPAPACASAVALNQCLDNDLTASQSVISEITSYFINESSGPVAGQMP